MPTFSIAEVLAVGKGEFLGGRKTSEFSGISIDSRTIKENELFIALRGDNFDGHDFVSEAYAKGATGAVISKRDKLNKGGDFALIYVKDTLAFLRDMASFHRQKFNIPLVGVTGSNGKTTAKEMIHKVLSSRYRVLKTSLNHNNQIGVSLTVLALDPSFEAAVVELGINHYQEMKVLKEISKPTVALFTNIGRSHLEFFDTPRNVLKAKISLVEDFNKENTVVINADDSLLREQFIDKKNTFKVITFGIKEKADFTARIIALNNDGVDFEINRTKFFIPALGLQNVYNALAAVTTGSLFGITPEESVASFKDFKLPSMRTNVLRMDNFILIDDTYNSNPDSMKFAVETLSNFNNEGKKILVCGDMLELGKNSESLHRELGELVACSKIDILLTVGNYSEEIVRRVSEIKNSLEIAKHFSKSADLSYYLNNIIKPGDAVLVKGSRSMHMEEIVKALSRIKNDAVSSIL